MVASFFSSVSLVSIVKEKRVSSLLWVFVFITSTVILWWDLGAAGWK